MKRLAILVVGICSLSLFADKEVTIKDINGNDFTTAFQQISSAYFYLHKPQGFNQRVANGDGSITIINPAFDYAGKKERLVEVERDLEQPDVWNDAQRAQALGKERAMLEGVVNTIDIMDVGLVDARELLDLAVEENDEDTLNEVQSEIDALTASLEKLEFRRMFSGEMDPNAAFLDIQSGSGGTEAQDWASMILRMYLRWGEQKGFKVELMEVSDGDVAGIKSATIRFEGDYAFGWLRTETGVHRLVRKSPFDSSSRRHTSFASVFVSPEIDDDIDI